MIRTCDIRPGARHASHAVHWPIHVAAGTWRRLIKEVFLIATLAVIYEEIRDHMVQAGAAAASHALLIVSAEQALGLFHERAVQDAIIGTDTITDAFNAYYGGTHFLIPILVLAWLWFRHPAHYARARTALAAVTGLAFIVFWLFPVAPPRLLPARFGIIDTLVAGSGHPESALISAAGDQYASMPSVHVAWAVWCAMAIYPVARHWAVRVLAIAYPLVTTLVVVSTGNHFFLDVIAGALLAFATWVAMTCIGAWLTVAIATRRSHRQAGRWRPVGARPAPAGVLRSPRDQ
ncbi:MAG TPA: phosphatase PAP2 family protein [Trebonia sp.]|jgi:membrane-associated phospholipid phosphatase|nr:phosphatase PAP2 family protein [Trebonia sp.]